MSYSHVKTNKGKIMTSKKASLQTLKQINILFICLNISPSSGYSKFEQNESFAHSFSYLLSQIIKHSGTYHNCIRISQDNTRILMVFKVDDKNTPFDLSYYLSIINKPITFVNQTLQSNNISILLQCSIAMDKGIAYINDHYLNYPLYKDYIWLENYRSRTILLSNIAGRDKYPPLLITHSVYKSLDTSTKKPFQKTIIMNIYAAMVRILLLIPLRRVLFEIYDPYHAILYTKL